MVLQARVLCVVPAKARSARLPGKNMRELAGRPLLAHTLEHARASRRIDRVVVSTDSPAIRDFCQLHGVSVPFLRPARQSAADVHASVPVLDALERMGGADAWTHCVMLLPTSPLRPAGAVDAVIERSIRDEANVLSVTRLGKSLLHLRSIDGEGGLQPVSQEVRVNFQSGDAPELHYLNGSIQCAPSAALLRHRTFHYGAPLAFPMEPGTVVDVDTEADLRLAELLLGRGERAAA